MSRFQNDYKPEEYIEHLELIKCFKCFDMRIDDDNIKKYIQHVKSGKTEEFVWPLSKSEKVIISCMVILFVFIFLQ